MLLFESHFQPLKKPPFAGSSLLVQGLKGSLKKACGYITTLISEEGEKIVQNIGF